MIESQAGSTPTSIAVDVASKRGADAGCAHCGLPVASRQEISASGDRFCCSGCQTAYQLIHGAGLQSYYRLVDGTSGQPLASGRPSNRFTELDDEAVQQAFVHQDNHGQCRAQLALEGIHCAACVWLIEKLPRVLAGVLEARVDYRKSTVMVRWKKDVVRFSQIAATLADLGYAPHPLREGESQNRNVAEERKLLVQIGIAAAAAGNNMLISVALYLGMFSQMAAPVESLLRWASCLVGGIAIVGPGRLFLKGAWSALRTRTPHMDLPIALGLLVGGIAGVINTVLGRGEIYFDSLAVLVFLLLVGRWIQFRQQRRAVDAIEMLYRLTPRQTERRTDDGWQPVHVDALQPGDTVRIRAGETVPADGYISCGQSAVDQSILTGESLPVEVGPDDKVMAGTLNQTATLQVTIVKTGRQTRIGKMMQLVEQSSADRPQIVQLADRIGGVFVTVVTGLALMTLIVWLRLQPSAAVDHSVALLIVACPCALALATPLTLAVALGRAAREKILIKGGDVLQRLGQPGVVWLDKTGTLTQAAMKLEDWVGDRTILPAVAALEEHSTHPVAIALARDAANFNTGASKSGQAESVAQVEQSSAGGIRGVYCGGALAIGSQRFHQQLGHGIPQRWITEAERMVERGLSPVMVAVNRRVLAVGGVGDPLRDDAPQAVARLRQLGWQIGILSGDHPAIVRRVAQQLKIEPDQCHGGVSPEFKAEMVRRSAEQQTTVMIGDGVNDSAALAVASVGIATSNSAEICLQAAPVYLGQPGLSSVVRLVNAGKSTMRTIRRNFAVSLAYNSFAVGLAALGWIHPLTAAVLMPISSLTVVSLALSSSTFGDTA